MKHPPYHLRTNKAVDRLLLVDLLRPLNPDSRFTYYSLAGPFLEDLRVMDHYFPQMRLVSLESNGQTWARQRFHQFSSRLTLEHYPLADYLASGYEPGGAGGDGTDVFWIDYTDLDYRRFEEFQVVLKAVPDGSVVRITLRAQPSIDFGSLQGRVSDEEIARLREEAQATFEDEFKKVLPHPPPSVSGTFSEYARAVQLMVQRAASTALDAPGSTRDFLPVQATRYNDGTQMVSITGVVALREGLGQMRDKLCGVNFANFEWAEPAEVNVPILSLKECLTLEEHLPCQDGEDAGETLYPVLNYMIADGEKATKRQLSQYADHHRDYPRFVRTAI